MPPLAIELGVNDIDRDGASATVSEALALPPLPPSVEATVPVVLFFVPTVVPWTSTISLHVPPGMIDAPDTLTDDAPAVAVTVPLHGPPRLGGVATTRPAGSVS